MLYDVAIIGAGVTGCAIAMELSKYDVNVCVIEREEDVCCGTSKANSAIIHAGFDAKPGTLKARLNVRGNAMMDDLSTRLSIPFLRNGSLVVCTKDQDPAGLDELLLRGQQNGVPDLRIIGRDEIREMEPNINDDVTSALLAPTGGIVCPFIMTIAFAENAAQNGVAFILNTNVDKVQKIAASSESVSGQGGYTLHVTDTVSGTSSVIESGIVINAAGVYADALNNMVSGIKLHITARKGEYCLLDHEAGDHVHHTIFQLPSAMGKGVLVTPTIHGNLMVGPTAADVDDKEAVNTTGAGLSSLAPTASLSVKNVPMRQVITSFAGLRAHEDGDDFIVGEASDSPGFYNVAGIESPGLSSAPAIAEMMGGLIADKLSCHRKSDYISTRKGILDPSTLPEAKRNALIKEHPEYGTVICRCEMVTEGEIIDAIRRPLGARSLDGVKRRTRAGMGRCQAGFCSPRVMEILEREVPMDIYDIGKCGVGSSIVIGRNKEL